MKRIRPAKQKVINIAVFEWKKYEAIFKVQLHYLVLMAVYFLLQYLVSGKLLPISAKCFFFRTRQLLFSVYGKG